MTRLSTLKAISKYCKIGMDPPISNVDNMYNEKKRIIFIYQYKAMFLIWMYYAGV